MNRLVVTGMLAGGLLLSGPAAAQASSSGTARTSSEICLGSNLSAWKAFHRAVPASGCVREYIDGTDPATWPVAWPKVAGACTLLSMRPMPGPLLRGSYDRYFRRLFRSAPPCSDFTIWHENANGAPGCTVGLCDPLGYPRILRDPARFKRMQVHVERLADGTHVKFGTIGCGPVASAPEWYARGLDWYGTDLYFNYRYLTRTGQVKIASSPFVSSRGKVSERLVWARLDQNIAEFRKISGQRFPLYRIGETNASPDYYRIPFWGDVIAWADHHNAERRMVLDTFWRAGKSSKQGGLSGPWPPSIGVIRFLRYQARIHA